VDDIVTRLSQGMNEVKDNDAGKPEKNTSYGSHD